MKEQPSIFDEPDEALESAADARAEADFLADRVISHEAARRWLRSWGTERPLPRPQCGE